MRVIFPLEECATKNQPNQKVKAENHRKIMAIFNESEMQCGFDYADSHMRDEASVDEKQMLTKTSKSAKFLSITFERKNMLHDPAVKKRAFYCREDYKIIQLMHIKAKAKNYSSNKLRSESKWNQKSKLINCWRVWIWWFVVCKVVDCWVEWKWCQRKIIFIRNIFAYINLFWNSKILTSF